MHDLILQTWLMGAFNLYSTTIIRCNLWYVSHYHHLDIQEKVILSNGDFFLLILPKQFRAILEIDSIEIRLKGMEFVHSSTE